MLRHSPFIVGRGCGNGTAILVLVGVQHEVALGGVECVISGMSGSVVKNGGALYLILHHITRTAVDLLGNRPVHP